MATSTDPYNEGQLSSDPARVDRSSWWQTLAGLVLLGLSIVLAWLILRALWTLFRGLQKEVAAALVAGSATVTVSVISIVLARRVDQKREVEREIRDRRVPAYEEFIAFWMEVLMSSKSGTTVPEERMFAFFQRFTQDVMIWGSDDVVRKWATLRRRFAGIEGGGEDYAREMMFEFEALLLALRREFGHRNRKLGRGSVLGLFINDIDEFV